MTSVVDLSALMTVVISSRPRPSTVPARPSTPSGSAMVSAKHLIAAAEPEHVAAAANMRLDVDVPALRAQKDEIADGGFAAGKNDDFGLGGNRLARPDEDQLDVGLHAQRIEIVEIGDAGENRHRDDSRGRRTMRRDRDRPHPPPAAMPPAAATARRRARASR